MWFYSHRICPNLLGTQFCLNTELPVGYLGESGEELNLAEWEKGRIKKFTDFFFLSGMFMCTCRWPGRLEESIGFPDAEVTGRCELPMGVENQTWVLWRCSKCFNCQTIPQSPYWLFLNNNLFHKEHIVRLLTDCFDMLSPRGLSTWVRMSGRFIPLSVWHRSPRWRQCG